MRFLLGLTVVLALLYGGYWVAGRSGKALAIETGIESLRAAGWQVEAEEVATRGFPSRFDTTFTAPRLVAPSGRVAWQAPWAQLLALAYLPNRAILALADSQTVTVDGQEIAVETRDMRASFRVAAAPALPLQNITVEAGPTAFTGPSWQARTGRMLAALREAAAPASYDLFAELAQIELPVAAGPLGPSLSRIAVDATLQLAAPLDRHADRPDPRALDLREAQAVWGPVVMTASGALTWEAGAPSGPVTLSVSNWQLLLDGLEAAALLDPTAAARIATAVRLVSGGAEDVELSLRLRDGTLFLGPLPLARF